MEPARLVKPSAILKRELTARRLDNSQLAKAIGVDPTTIVNILNGSQPITKQIASKLSNYMKIHENIWLNLESNYRRRLIDLHK